MRKRERPGLKRFAVGTQAACVSVAMAVGLQGTIAFAQNPSPAAAVPAAPASVPSTDNGPPGPALAFSIPAGPLSSALAAFGEVSNLQVLYPADLARGIASPGVSGSYTPQQALQRLLANTGLGYRFTNARTITIEKLAANGTNGPMTLPPVQVEGQGSRETAYGPGVGYIAHQSAVGTKTDTPILETPQSISVVTPDQIEAQNPQTLDQALRYTAGIESESRADFTGFDFAYGRGFVLDQYLDGLKLQGASAYISPSIDIYNIERIDVLRGPASVLYGQASPGGLLDIVSKMPTAQPFHEVMLEGGSYGSAEGAFDFSGPLDPDGHFLYRLTGLARTADGQVDYTKNQRVSISPALTWQPDNDTKLTLLMNYQRDPWAGLYNFVPATGTILPNPNGKLPTSFYAGDPSFNKVDRTQGSIGYQFEHRFDDVWTFRQNFRYMHDDGDLNQVLPIDMLNDRTMERYVLADHDNLDAVTLDNQAQADFTTGSVRHKLLAGVDYQQTFFHEELGENFAPNLDIFAPVYYQAIPAALPMSDAHQSTDQIGVYAQDQIRWQHWALLLGGREDWAGTTTNDTIAETNASQFDRKFTYRGGLVYLFDNGIAPYASYTTSFQPEIGTEASGAAFKPTTAQQYEAGIKYQPPGYNSFITASAYQLTQQNVPTADPDNPAFEIQTGEVRTRGVEIEAHANLTPGFNVIASYGYADPVVTKTTTDDLGKIPINVPRQLASLWSDYTIQSGTFAGLGFGGGVRFVGATYGDPENTLRVPSYTLFDAAVTYDLGHLRPDLHGLTFAVNASNLFDKTYVSECSNAAYCLYGLRRTVLASLRYRW